MDNDDVLPQPLATIRLLVSPLNDDPMPPGSVSCTLDNFLGAAAGWREDALQHQDNVTWLYLCGHGFELSDTEQIFLMEDFGGGPGAFLRNSINVNNLVNGMASSRGERNMARTQWYFLDMSRLRGSDLHDLQWRNSTAVFDADVPTLEEREAAVYYAAEPGSPAFSRTGDNPQSLFTAALLECLEGSDAAVNVNGKWCVTSLSLQTGLDRVLLRQTKGHDVRQRVVVSGSIRGGTLCYFRKPPTVHVTIFVDPPEARETCKVEVRDHAGVLVATFSPPIIHPTPTPLPAGIYAVTLVDVERPASGISQLVMVAPPEARISMVANFPLRGEIV